MQQHVVRRTLKVQSLFRVPVQFIDGNSKMGGIYLESRADWFVLWLLYDFGKAALAPLAGDAVLHSKLEHIEVQVAHKVLHAESKLHFRLDTRRHLILHSSLECQQLPHSNQSCHRSHASQRELLEQVQGNQGLSGTHSS